MHFDLAVLGAVLLPLIDQAVPPERLLSRRHVCHPLHFPRVPEAHPLEEILPVCDVEPCLDSSGLDDDAVWSQVVDGGWLPEVGLAIRGMSSSDSLDVAEAIATAGIRLCEGRQGICPAGDLLDLVVVHVLLRQLAKISLGLKQERREYILLRTSSPGRREQSRH